MHIAHVTYKDYMALLAQPFAAPSVVASPATAALVVDCSDIDVTDPAARRTAGSAQSLPVCVVIGVNHPPGLVSESVDVVVRSSSDLDLIIAAVRANPQAASVLVQVLRESLKRSVAAGLQVESLAYSTLQHGAEFEHWLARGAKPRPDASTGESCVLVQRQGDELHVVLNRPDKRNAYSAAMRDGLCEALQVARADDTVKYVRLSGAGVAFCAGGDLSEFGSARDAARAHLSRATQSAGALLHELADRVIVDVSGACIGAGIELPGFAGCVRARRDSRFQLPEVAMGLIPGAGGTVSLPRRIGRHRTAWLALSGCELDVDDALRWGLVDEVLPA